MLRTFPGLVLPQLQQSNLHGSNHLRAVSAYIWTQQILRVCHFWPSFQHISTVNMIFLHAQDLPWVGPPTATTKQPPGLKSSQSWGSLHKNSADFTFLSILAPFRHLSMVNMTFLHGQDLPWVGPPTATTKQPPGLKSSQSCVSLRKKSADFTFLTFLAPVWAHFHGQYDIFACSGPSLGWSNHSNSKATSGNLIATFCGSQLWKNSAIFDNFCNFSFFV